MVIHSRDEYREEGEKSASVTSSRDPGYRRAGMIIPKNQNGSGLALGPTGHR